MNQAFQFNRLKDTSSYAAFFYLVLPLVTRALFNHWTKYPTTKKCRFRNLQLAINNIWQYHEVAVFNRYLKLLESFLECLLHLYLVTTIYHLINYRFSLYFASLNTNFPSSCIQLGAFHKLCQPKLGGSRPPSPLCQPLSAFPKPPLPPSSAMSSFS